MASKYPRNLGNVFCKVVICLLIVAVIFGALFGISFLANKGYSPESLAYGEYKESSYEEFRSIQEAAIKARDAGKVSYPKQVKVSSEFTFSASKEKCPIVPSVQVHGTDRIKYTCDKFEDFSLNNIEANSEFDGKIFKKFAQEKYADNDFTNIPVEGDVWYSQGTSYVRYKENGNQSKTKYSEIQTVPYALDYIYSLSFIDLGMAIDNMFNVPMHQQYAKDNSNSEYIKLKLFCAYKDNGISITVVFTKDYGFKVAIIETVESNPYTSGESVGMKVRSVIEADNGKFNSVPKDAENYIPVN